MEKNTIRFENAMNFRPIEITPEEALAAANLADLRKNAWPVHVVEEAHALSNVFTYQLLVDDILSDPLDKFQFREDLDTTIRECGIDPDVARVALLATTKKLIYPNL